MRLVKSLGKKPRLAKETLMKGHLIWGGVDTIDLVREFGTPLYVIDANAIKKNWHNAHTAISTRYENTKIFYAYKANSHMAVCKLLCNLGAGAEVASGGELYIALKIGVPADRIVFDGPNKSATELTMAIKSQAMINADSLAEVEKIQRISKDLGERAHIGIRVNPDIRVETHPHLSTALKLHKFGVAIESAPEVCKFASRKDMIDLVGLHTHLGSNILDTHPFSLACEKMLDLINELRNKYAISIKFLDLGGGLGMSYREREGAPSFDHFAEAITSMLSRRIKKLGLGEIALVLELGRRIVANSGILLTEVGIVKRTPRINWALVDAGMNHLIRPALYGSYHKIAVANKMLSRRNEEYSIGGPCCESADILAKGRKLPRMVEGDVLAVLDVGAYGFSMSSNYNSYPRPSVVFIENGVPHLIRRRESYEDLVRLEEIPSSLDGRTVGTTFE